MNFKIEGKTSGGGKPLALGVALRDAEKRTDRY